MLRGASRQLGEHRDRRRPSRTRPTPASASASSNPDSSQSSAVTRSRSASSARAVDARATVVRRTRVLVEVAVHARPDHARVRAVARRPARTPTACRDGRRFADERRDLVGLGARRCGHVHAGVDATRRTNPRSHRDVRADAAPSPSTTTRRATSNTSRHHCSISTSRAVPHRVHHRYGEGARFPKPAWEIATSADDVDGHAHRRGMCTSTNVAPCRSASAFIARHAQFRPRKT